MKQARGFSLIELMIALTLGVLIVSALSAVFLSSRATFITSSGSSALADDGRYSMELITRAIRSSGYMQCMNAATGRVVTVYPTTASVLFDFADQITGYEATGTNPAQSVAVPTPPVSGDTSASDWTPSLPVLPNTPNVAMASVAGPIKGSDVLIVHGTTQQTPLNVSAPTTGATISVTANTTTLLNGTTSSIPANSLAVISDCAKAVAFQVTGSAANSVTLTSTSAITPGTISATFLPAGDTVAINFFTGALVNVPTTSFFFIAPGRDTDSALFRGDLYCPPAGGGAANSCTGAYTLNSYEIVPDVENMQLLYGVLTGTSVTSYVTADKVTSWNSIASVRIALLLASPPNTVAKVAGTYQLAGTTVTTPADGRQRQVYEVTVTMRDSLQ